MAATIVLDSYNSVTGCMYFNIGGTPLPTSIFIEDSPDNVNWSAGDSYPITSPVCGLFFAPNTYIRIRLTPSGVVSNSINTNVVSRTPIEFPTDISFCNSPIHLRLQNDLADSSIQEVLVKLYAWNGSINALTPNPIATFYKKKISDSDKYISLRIDEQIKGYLINPINAPNTNQPNFAYNELTNPAITGQGIFWQAIADITSTVGTIRKIFRTSFATLGYRYREEQTFGNVFSITLPNYNLWYNDKIHNYITQEFDLTKSLADATSTNIIKVTDYIPTTMIRESRDPYLIVYLNKLGLWSFFTPHGKATETEKIDTDSFNISYRDPSRIDASYTHSKLNDNFDVTKRISINTGSLFEEMVDAVRQIVYSPKIYLIRFKCDLQTETTIGITIDNTYVTIDDTTITIDSQMVIDELINKYKTHEQIPVILTDSDFQIKNRVNDKNTIDYTLNFEVTANSILDL